MAFNSEEHDWTDMAIAWEGKVLARVTKVMFKEKVELEALYGAGRKPFAVKQGNYSVEGSVEMFKSDFNNLLKITKNKGVLGMTEMVITIAFGLTNAPEIITIIGVTVSDAGLETKQGDKSIKIDLPFIAIDLKRI
jgi:hypothetical protein